MPSDDAKRRYRKRKRARQEEETRRRITEAAVELHRTVGPAETGVTDVARRAGVSRTTVYNHFPTATDLFLACSAHWASRNPFPSPSAWAGIHDPSERLRTALAELYEWYGGNQDMLGNVLRDVRRVSSLAEVMEGLWWPWVREIVDTLAAGMVSGDARRLELEAALELVVDFESWRRLTGAGLSGRQAAELAARMVEASVSS